MQIHELTRPRKVNEGFFNALANKAISTALGGADVMDKSGPAQSREQGFQSMVNSPAAKTLATTMQAAWAQTVKNFLMNSKDSAGNPATSLKYVTQPSVQSLLPELEALVNKMIGAKYGAGFNYRNLANNVEDPVAKAGIQEVIARITEYTQAIYKATVEGVDPKALADDWVKLVGDGILPAQNSMAYDKNSSSAIIMSSEAEQLASKLKLDDGDIMKIRQVIKAPGGNQYATVILNKKTPATVDTPLVRRFGQQTKLTDTELASLVALAQDAANDAAFKEIFGLRA